MKIREAREVRGVASKPAQKHISVTVDVSYLWIRPGFYIAIAAEGGRQVEVVCKEDGTFQVCVDDETLESGIHSFEEIYGADPFKMEE